MGKWLLLIVVEKMHESGFREKKPKNEKRAQEEKLAKAANLKVNSAGLFVAAQGGMLSTSTVEEQFEPLQSTKNGLSPLAVGGKEKRSENK